MRGMAPGPAGEQPFLGQVLDEIRARGNLPLRQRAQDIGPHEALGRLQVGKAPGAVVLGVAALVVARTIPALVGIGTRRVTFGHVSSSPPREPYMRLIAAYGSGFSDQTQF